jgi:hypothetical protein
VERCLKQVASWNVTGYHVPKAWPDSFVKPTSQG